MILLDHGNVQRQASHGGCFKDFRIKSTPWAIKTCQFVFNNNSWHFKAIASLSLREWKSERILYGLLTCWRDDVI